MGLDTAWTAMFLTSMLRRGWRVGTKRTGLRGWGGRKREDEEEADILEKLDERFSRVQLLGDYFSEFAFSPVLLAGILAWRRLLLPRDGWIN